MMFAAAPFVNFAISVMFVLEKASLDSFESYSNFTIVTTASLMPVKYVHHSDYVICVIIIVISDTGYIEENRL